jgi:UDP-N-acetylmuramoyl-tripeptide--D-alanyl-D-alanine ligase
MFENQVTSLYELFLSCQGRFTTDTRKIQGGELYFALKGENFNGNLFAKSALEKGASYVVIDEDMKLDDSKTFRCKNVLLAMQQLATHHRRQFDIPFIAIAGSNGKTTTKELLSLCLQQRYNVHATKGNFNNHIGVPITLLEMESTTEIAVIEIGTNAFGEIAFLCDILEPNYGIITNIGKEHLEGFGDIEGVAKEESALYNYLQKHDGFAFVNNDDRYLYRMSHRLDKTRTYSAKTEADDYFTVETLLPYLELKSDNSIFKSKLQGLHNAENMCAAISISRQFNVSDKKISKALSSYQSSNNRSEWRELDSNSFMLDAYNANPSSMLAALKTFRLASSPKKVVLLGDMFELGATRLIEHEEIAMIAWEIKDAEVYLVGTSFSEVCTMHGKMAFDNVDELIEFLRVKNYSNTWFLIKGSRGMRMERVMEVFEA